MTTSKSLGMKLASVAVAATLSTTAAHAGGLDFSGQDVGLLFEQGNVARVSLGFSSPNLSGEFAGADTGNIGVNRFLPFAGVKWDQNEELSFAIYYDQPWAGGVRYDSSALGGTDANISSDALNFMARYQIGNGFSVHGGLRVETFGAQLSSPASAAPVIPSYEIIVGDSTGVGATLGFAWENPALFQRVALTYHSRVSHSFTGTESSNVVAGGAPQPAQFDVDTPQSLNLELQSGLSPVMIGFANLRWVEWSAYEVAPPLRGAVFGAPLDAYPDDTITWELGLVRVFSPQFFGVVTIGGDTGHDRVSALSPFEGFNAIGLAGVYNINQNISVTGGVRYLALGDVDDSAVSTINFQDNDVIAVGVSMDYRF